MLNPLQVLRNYFRGSLKEWQKTHPELFVKKVETFARIKLDFSSKKRY
jgi:hypothetical protein